MKSLTRIIVTVYFGILRPVKLKIVLCFIAPLLLIACAAKPVAPNPGLRESFHTEKTVNGAKRFTYSLEFLSPDVPGPYTRSNRTSRRNANAVGPKASKFNRVEKNFNYGLKLKLQESNFCRDGYFELERSVSAMGAQVRGECRDGYLVEQK